MRKRTKCIECSYVTACAVSYAFALGWAVKRSMAIAMAGDDSSVSTDRSSLPMKCPIQIIYSYYALPSDSLTTRSPVPFAQLLRLNHHIKSTRRSCLLKPFLESELRLVANSGSYPALLFRRLSGFFQPLYGPIRRLSGPYAALFGPHPGPIRPPSSSSGPISPIIISVFSNQQPVQVSSVS